MAFTANIVLNFDVMTMIGKVVRLIPVVAFLVVDIASAVWRATTDAHDNVSWAAHLGGSTFFRKFIEFLIPKYLFIVEIF